MFMYVYLYIYIYVEREVDTCILIDACNIGKLVGLRANAPTATFGCQATVEALNIASATKAHVDTISVASPAACGPLSPSYSVEAKRVTLLPRPNRLQVQHCIRGRGPQISCHSSSLSGPCPLVFCSALAIFRASTVAPMM